MAKNEEENTGYITQSTRHSMLVSLSREINVISDENAVLYDTIIELMHLILLMIQPHPT